MVVEVSRFLDEDDNGVFYDEECEKKLFSGLNKVVLGAKTIARYRISFVFLRSS